MSPLGDICRRYQVEFHSYADDQQIYLGFHPSTEKSKDHCVTTLENCVSEIRTWMRINFLKLNDDKTEVLMVGTRTNLDRVGGMYIQIGDDEIQASDAVRNLGVYFDKFLKGTIHVNKLTSSLYITICIIMLCFAFIILYVIFVSLLIVLPYMLYYSFLTLCGRV